MRSLINRSCACRDSKTDTRDEEKDRRATEYVGELKRRCAGGRWNLIEIDFLQQQRKKPKKK